MGDAHHADCAEQGPGRRSLTELRDPCAPRRRQLSTRSDRWQVGEVGFRAVRRRGGRRLGEDLATSAGLLGEVLLRSDHLTATQTDWPREAKGALRRRDGLWC